MRRFFFILAVLLFAFQISSLSAEPILSEEDRALYREIFVLQDKEDFKKADVKIKQLKNPILMSYIEAQRYLSKTYITSKKELSAWLNKYPGHPDAYKIYNLAKKKGVKPTIPRPTNPASPRRACTDSRSFDPLELIIRRPLPHLSGQKRKEGRRLMSAITTSIIRGKTKAAYQTLHSKEVKALFRPIDYDSAATALSFLYFTEKEYDKAIEVGLPAASRSGKQIPIVNWTLGLVYWQKNDFSNSFKFFKDVVENPRASDDLTAASAYWASRSALRLKNYPEVNRMLEISARHPHTFYGLISERLLGDDSGYSFSRPATYSRRGGKAQTQRVLALLELGLQDKAIAKLRALYLAGNKEAEELILMLEEDPSFSGLLERSIAFGGRISLVTGRTIYYPVPEWEPLDGWQIDRALVYAFIRQESCFNQDAVSKVGARGLMQLMPQTARLIARMMNMDINQKRLYEPELNIALGQRYISHLMSFNQIGKNLIFIATGYNAGPGNLLKWYRTVDHRDDPLMFIEAMPSRETRSFVKRVLTNFWIYRTLLDQDNPSIDQIIRGSWPIYQDQDLKYFLVPTGKEESAHSFPMSKKPAVQPKPPVKPEITESYEEDVAQAEEEVAAEEEKSIED